MIEPATADNVTDCLIGLLEEEGVTRQTALAHHVALALTGATIPEGMRYGIMRNGREVGVTYHIGGWVFAIYEHRLSTDIVINGVLATDLDEDGNPYHNNDQNDVLCRTPPKDVEHAVARLSMAFDTAAADNPTITRKELKSKLQDA
ncbi:hypothetical protein SEA_OCTOBIEN14_10 [Gordonia phage Octobien14]|uniref:Uncharacterized protein n=1 Tax=Gordonia phage Octobien14 TaxID=2483673 RepID=A0A3G3MAP6_9CAUD|nr:hypothetical protein L3Y22_gp010 [Gordonia phage Octobien14]AYR03158.1 hypothetical protein SEA_OCTOBIEN14_10 [Gordonia phage Octobien14]